MRRTCLRNILRLVLLIVLSSCHNGGDVEISVREAQQVVTQADSLWHAGKMYGVDEGDSATLAQAYETLKNHSAFSRQFAEVFPFVHCTSSLDTFSHACYHYGKLLRTKDDPVSAMQAFIDAIHSKTHDYHILGRVYSNMGSICHLAGEYSIAADMFQTASNLFLRDNDTTLYYYALTDLAYEKAEIGDSVGTCHILKSIDSIPHIDYVVNLTRAQLNLKCDNYHSAIDYAHLALKDNSKNAQFPTLILAQSFFYLGEKDSAIYYARLVLNENPPLEAQNNALYILTNDEDKDILAVRETATTRADIQKQLEIRHGRLSQAVQLLQQDLNRKPDYRWLYAVILTILVIGVLSLIFIHRKRRQHTLLSQQIDDLAMQNKDAETHHEKILSDIEKHKRTIINEVEQNCKLIINAKSFPQNIYWNKYKKMCSIVDGRFYMLASKLHTKYKLNETETRLCVLTLLDCKYDLIADLLYRSSSSIGTLKIRVAKKLGTTAKVLRMYLIENECIN